MNATWYIKATSNIYSYLRDNPPNAIQLFV